MTTGPEHYREAERLAALAAEYWQQPWDREPTTDPDELKILQHIREQARADAMAILALAQVHATLAAAAATAELDGFSTLSGGGMTGRAPTQASAWKTVLAPDYARP